MSALTQAARGQACTLRFMPTICSPPDTVVACHLPYGNRGVALKAPDWWIAFGCRMCHDIIDRRAYTTLPHEVVLEQILRGHRETMEILINKGLIRFRPGQ